MVETYNYDTDSIYMKEALLLAKKARDINEVPVGAVIVKDGKIIGRGYNRREIDRNPLAHAEILAIKEASENLNSWRFINCDLYVTLEPCHMCTGAIINSRVRRVIYGASDFKAGCCGTKIDFNRIGFNHNFLVTSDVLKDECSNILSVFFLEIRKKKV